MPVYLFSCLMVWVTTAKKVVSAYRTVWAKSKQIKMIKSEVVTTELLWTVAAVYGTLWGFEILSCMLCGDSKGFVFLTHI